MDVCNSSIQHIDDMNNNFMLGVKDTMKTLTTKLVETINKLTIENKEAIALNNVLKEQVKGLEARLNDLTKELEMSVEEQRQLLKVSRVVAIERENARLRTELQQFEVKFQALKEHQSSTKSQFCSASIQTASTTQDNTTNTDEQQEEQLNVREKKIKGVFYYVSDDNNVYTKNNDDSIGDIIGTIEGKKVKWL
jgi:chromosome segregation ATPase